MLMQVALEEAVLRVCPILGISFGRLDDRETWRIDYEEKATEGQRQAAREVLRDFVWDDAAKEKGRKDDRDRDYGQQLMFKYQYRLYLQTNPGATFSDFMDHVEATVQE